jgi:hypothetical protein
MFIVWLTSLSVSVLSLALALSLLLIGGIHLVLSLVLCRSSVFLNVLLTSACGYKRTAELKGLFAKILYDRCLTATQVCSGGTNISSDHEGCRGCHHQRGGKEREKRIDSLHSER